ELFIGRREIGDVDLDVMLVVFRQWLVGLEKDQMLLRPDLHPGLAPLAVFAGMRLRAQHLAIEARDTVDGALRHIETHIGQTEPDRAEELLVRLVDAEAIAPGAG